MDRFARALVRWRWVVLVVWAVSRGGGGASGRPRRRRLLNIRGGSDAAHRGLPDRGPAHRPIQPADRRVLRGHRSRPRPRSTSRPQARRSTRCWRRCGDSRIVRGLVSYRSTGDTTFVSRDRRATFMIVALEATRGDSAGALVLPVRELVKATMARAGRREPVSSAVVTGRAPLDLDVRTVVTRDSAEGEKRLLPLTLVILVLAFGALVAAVLPLIVGVLAIAVSLAIIGVIAHVHPDVGVRAQHDDDDRAGRRASTTRCWWSPGSGRSWRAGPGGRSPRSTRWRPRDAR